MNIYLAWAPHFLTNKETLPLFDLEISQEENNFAKARLLIDARAPLPLARTEALIQGENGEVFFKGFLVGTPVKLEGDLAHIELIACPRDFKEKNERLQKESRISPYWDGLWVPPEKHLDFQEIQDVHTSSLYCDKVTGTLSRSDWFEGRQTVCLSQHFFPESLQIKIKGTPLRACTVLVHAHWVQNRSGISNLRAPLERAFPHFKMSTYTKKALLEKWPEPGKRVGKSGISILKSEVKPMRPSSSLYPSYSAPLPLAEEGDPFRPCRLKRYWFKPTLWVRWQAHQKRKETLSVTLFHSFQSLFPGEAEQKTVEFTLQNINPAPEAYVWRPEAFYQQGSKVSHEKGVYTCKKDHMAGLSFEDNQAYWAFKTTFHTPLGDPARASFFLTERGYKAAEHAMERAKYVLAKSARCIEVSFEGPWDAFKNVTTDTSVTLSDPRLPRGQIKGKVIHYALIAKGETGERLGRVTLLCAVRPGTEEKIERKAIPHYTLDDYCEELYQVHENACQQTLSGLSYFRYDDKGPPEEERAKPLLRGVEVINGPRDQEAELLRHAYKSPSAVRKALAQKPTRVRLFFKDLRTKERLEHVIPVTMAASWSVPKDSYT